MRQREARNRRTPKLPRGGDHWSAKLSDREVQALRKARELGISADDCASIWKISRSTVYNAWAHVHYPPQVAALETERMVS